MPHSVQPTSARAWWHSATIYQIYPASFKDSNADGWGDIQGIISKVDYIASLGVDAVWLSPCYTSPFIDHGYDIANYREIDPRFGTVADIELLISRLKDHNIKLLMDLVVNHTSDQHQWFQESRNPASPRRDWYVWRKGRRVVQDDGMVETLPPNNWESLFKGSAWEMDETTGDFYLHLFATGQPDLNWDNPAVRKAVYDDMRFWLDKGIGGFRMDVINLISKPKDLPDVAIVNPKSPYQPASHLYANGPHVHEYIREIREVLNQYPGVISIGEMPFTHDASEVRKYVEPGRNELNMVFQFDIFHIDIGPHGRFTPYQWQLAALKAAIAKWQQSLSFSSGAWGTTFLESHDVARSVTRFGDRTVANRFKVAKMLAMMETTLSGTLFMHQSQEIGMANLTDDIPIDAYSDIETKNFLRDMMDLRNVKATEREQVSLADIVREFGDQVRLKARDHGRMPMPWDANKTNAGFSDASGNNTKLWTVLNGDSKICNVAEQDKNASSVLNFWRRMLIFRKEHADTLVFGDFIPTTLESDPVFAYHRIPLDEDKTTAKNMFVVLNMKNEPVSYELPKGRRYSLLQSTTVRGEDEIAKGTLFLEPYESMVLQY